jgi:antitoxin component of MazEF toxin-antitoxin module
MENKSWEVTIEEDKDGELILPFPPELIRENGWQEGDELEFEIQERCILITNTTAKKRKENE